MRRQSREHAKLNCAEHDTRGFCIPPPWYSGIYPYIPIYSRREEDPFGIWQFLPRCKQCAELFATAQGSLSVFGKEEIVQGRGSLNVPFVQSVLCWGWSVIRIGWNVDKESYERFALLHGCVRVLSRGQMAEPLLRE
ncbi:MAG: hypothetical protein GY820_00435 [Gammaproteobacteria bacterium]|nr:hypothetical protein [Gammaproteobacteria bacterium]